MTSTILILSVGHAAFMLDWKVLGKKTLPVGIQDAWIDQLRLLAGKKDDGQRFLEMMDIADIAYKFDTIRELHIFQVKFSADVEKEDLEYFAGYVEKLQKSARVVMVSLEGKKQKATVVLSSDQDINEYIQRQKERGEKNLEED